jgi:hypothetical protein
LNLKSGDSPKSGRGQAGTGSAKQIIVNCFLILGGGFGLLFQSTIRLLGFFFWHRIEEIRADLCLSYFFLSKKYSTES